MKLNSLLTDVRNELVEASASFWSDTELIALANRAERDFVQKTRCLEGKVTISTIVGQPDYPLPANWLSALAIFINTPSTTGTPSWARLTPSNLEKESQVNANFLATDSTVLGVPHSYMIWNKSLYLDNVPDAAYTITMFFKAKPIPMIVTTDEINIDDSLSEAINNFILWKAWKKEQEQGNANEAMVLYLDNVKQGHRWVKKQSGDQRFRLDIESPRNFGAGASGFNPFGR
jgi:hypothetical protein